MDGYTFIFSTQRKHRIARHVVFWLAWCVAFNVLFHFPIHVFKGWNVNGPGTKNLQLLGLPLFFLKTLLVNSFLGVIVPQIALTYFLLDWLLPNYYYKRKNYFVTILVTICTLILFYGLAVVFKYSPVIYNYIVNLDNYIPSVDQMYQVVLIDQLGSLPLVLGFALMIKLVKRWWQKDKQTEQLSKANANAALQLLKDQVHPHFLFNTINNIYFFTLTNSSRGALMIKKLTGLLNYILNDCKQQLVPLEQEIKMIQDYVALEKIRYGEDEHLAIEIKGDYRDKMIHPLLLIPFVENSFKHGASKMIAHPYVKVTIYIEDNMLHFMVSNAKPESKDERTTIGNIGLKNVTKRLELLYPGTHFLRILTEQHSFEVSLSLELHDVNGKRALPEELKLTSAYTMA